MAVPTSVIIFVIISPGTFS
jgi:hypothetical protein